jgi:hypothetical protein
VTGRPSAPRRIATLSARYSVDTTWDRSIEP